MNHTQVLVLHNGRAAPRARIARLEWSQFAPWIESAPTRGRRVAALFGMPAAGERGADEHAQPRADTPIDIVAVLAVDETGTLEVASARLAERTYPSLTPSCPQVHLFEREIAEQWGVVPEGHPWLKPVRFHHAYRPGGDAWGRSDDDAIVPGVMDFYRVKGEEVHEVAVGPVHAGVIEPGHFRFQCHGEEVLHLEIALGYQHRGVERALVGGPTKRTLHYMETLAGDTTIGHTTAYCEAMEGLAGGAVSPSGAAWRAVALELERLANHTGDLGALAGDVGYLPTASYCGRLRGDYLNMTALICGNRFGRGLVRPGGVGTNVQAAPVADLLARLDAAMRDVTNAVELLWSTASVLGRFEDTGRVPAQVVSELGLVGVAARACGLRRDCRKTHPSGMYRFAYAPVSTWHSGDVFARAFVRWQEIKASTAFIKQQLQGLSSAATTRIEIGRARPDHICVALVEGWRGEICHVALTDAAGRLAHYKVVDPSFHNWTALALALRDQQISDFPLCNKSFNLSYCGHDL